MGKSVNAVRPMKAGEVKAAAATESERRRRRTPAVGVVRVSCAEVRMVVTWFSSEGAARRHATFGSVSVLVLKDVQYALRALLTVERSEEHTSELQSRGHLVCRLLLEKT